MSPRDADEGEDFDGRRDIGRRTRRDVLELGGGRPRQSDERRYGHPRDLDTDGDGDVDDDRRGRPRDVSRRRDDDRDDRRGARGDDRRSDDDDDARRPPRDRGDGRRQDDEESDRKDADRQEKGKKDEGGDKKGDEKDDKEAKDAEERRRKRRPIVITVAVVVGLLLLAGGVYFWLSTRGKSSTDDAYTDGNVVSIAPQVSGQVISLDVEDNQFVHKGDPLIHIDPRQFIYSQEQSKGVLDANKAQIANQKLGVEIAKKNFPAALQLAQANLASSKASLLLAQANYDRQKNLPRQATTQQDVDTATANYQQAQAQVEQSQARVVQAEPVQQNIGQSVEQVNQLTGQAEQAQGQLDQATLNVEWTIVRAPQDGWVTRRNVNAGNYVAAGTQIMSLVTTDVWVTANFKETELNGMRPGQPVTISVDAYPDLDLHGHVDSIQLGSGSRFSAFPAENATGNFVKIVQRVPVKILIDSGLKKDEPLPLGVSVEPTVMLR